MQFPLLNTVQNVKAKTYLHILSQNTVHQLLDDHWDAELWLTSLGWSRV